MAAATGELVDQNAGILNLGVEGMMLVGRTSNAIARKDFGKLKIGDLMLSREFQSRIDSEVLDN